MKLYDRTYADACTYGLMLHLTMTLTTVIVTNNQVIFSNIVHHQLQSFFTCKVLQLTTRPMRMLYNNITHAFA